MIQFTPTTLAELQSWRFRYFDSLPQVQDMHSESMISWMPGVVCHLIQAENASVGYFILNKTKELVEFYLNDGLLTQKEAVFSQMLKCFEIKSVYCKSFDQVLLSCCYKFSGSSKLVGYLFQDYQIESNIVFDKSILIRLATMDDAAYLSSFDNELLEEGETIEPYIRNNSVYMFMKGVELIGCGYLFNITPSRIHHDVGMWVNKPFRQKGYATQIIRYLMNHCFDNGFIPTAGCAEDNTASRRTLEKCGFISRFCLINFEF